MKNLVLLAAILALAVPALANDGGVWGTGGSVELISPKHSLIRMVSERVEARLDPNGIANVRCTFVFGNDGEATTVKMGFPESAGGASAGERITDFRSWVDGKQVKTTLMPDKNVHDEQSYRAWYVKDVRFSAGQTITVVDTYTGGMGRDITGATDFNYILTTGASWKGNIGEAIITVDLSAMPEKYRINSITPKGYTLQGSIINWTLRDFEPKENVYVSFVPNPAVYIRHKGDDWETMPSILEDRKNGIAMVSARGLQYHDLLGIGLTWQNGECEITANGKTLRLTPGSKVAVLNNAEGVELPEAPYLRDGRIIVPAAAVIKALGGASQLVKENGAEKLIIAL